MAQLEATVDMQSESTELARTQLNHLQAELLRVKKELMEAYVAMAKKDDLLEVRLLFSLYTESQFKTIDSTIPTGVLQSLQGQYNITTQARRCTCLHFDLYFH